jgi:hypothetical protein
MKTSGRRSFMEIAPHTITADAFWYRGTINFARGMSDSDADDTLSFARSIVAPEQTYSRPKKIFCHPRASLAEFLHV